MNEEIAEQFRKPSGTLGNEISKKMLESNKCIYVELFKIAEVQDGFEILEIGLGPGFGISYLTENYNINYVGIDFSELMCENCRLNFSSLIRDGRVQIVCEDFLRYNGQDGKFDLVIFANVTYFWNDLMLPFVKISKLLKNNGNLVFYMDNKSLLEKSEVASNSQYFSKHSFEDVVNCLKILNFKDIQHFDIFESNEDQIVIKAKNVNA